MESEDLSSLSPTGTVRELWRISFPLMISSLASLLMVFIDRIFLAHYSVAALNASVNAGTLAWAFLSGFAMVSSMSEVFVAQYHGAKQYERIGSPVWQMIWLSIFSLLFFLPLGIWGSPLIFGENRNAEMEIEYFRWLIFFCPSYALTTALGGFFIGQGKTKLLIWLAIGVNVLNVLFDRLLIFGVPGWIPEMGVQGAAIATCLGYLIESAILLAIFLKRKNRALFGSGNWQPRWEEMKKCLRVGLPHGTFYALELFGWAVFYWQMTSLSDLHLTLSGICQSFTNFLFFFCDGLSRGSTALAGNLIGAGRKEWVYRVMRAGIILLSLFTLLTSFFLLVDPGVLMHMLFSESYETEGLMRPDTLYTFQVCLGLSFLYIFFDGIRWLLAGLLIAAGDTLFLLVSGSLSVWLFLIVPIHLLVVRNHLPVEYAWVLTVTYALLFSGVYAYRFLKGAWQEIDLLFSGSEYEETDEE